MQDINKEYDFTLVNRKDIDDQIKDLNLDLENTVKLIKLASQKARSIDMKQDVSDTLFDLHHTLSDIEWHIGEIRELLNKEITSIVQKNDIQ